MNSFQELIDELKILSRNLSALAGIRLLAGKNIRITETDAGILIEAETPELPNALKQWILAVDRKVFRESGIIAGNGILVEEQAGTRRISLRPRDTPDRKSGGGKEVAAEVPDIPYRVICEGSTTDENEITTWNLRVCGYNPDAGRYVQNMLIGGVQTFLTVPEATLTVQNSCWVYLNLTYNPAGEEQILITTGASFPEPLNSNYDVPLAYVRIADGACRITQIQYGQIEVKGRVI